jgi:hypothetical protein
VSGSEPLIAFQRVLACRGELHGSHPEEDSRLSRRHVLVSIIHESAVAEYTEELDGSPKRLLSLASGITRTKHAVAGGESREHLILEVVHLVSPVVGTQ